MRDTYSSQDELGSEASAEIVLGRESKSRYRLEHRAFPRRLVSTDYELREINVATDTLRSQLVNDVEELFVVL